MRLYLCMIGVYFLYILPSSVCVICSTCLCYAAENGPVINCRGKDLGSNDILNFDLLMLERQNTFNELILSNNSIVRLPGHLTKRLNYLKTLDLSENLMTEVHTGEFAVLSNLENVNLSKNLLKTFDDSLLKVLPMLSALNLSYNIIDTIQHTVEYTGNINLLDLSHNNISDLPNHFIESLPCLEYLDLSFNKIHSLKEKGFIYSNLKILRINNNFLTSLPLQTLPNSLIELYSGHNSITEIFYKPSQIEVLDIEHNHISEINTNLTMLNQIKHLNVRGNMLSDFPSIVLQKLRTLDISFNNFPIVPVTVSIENFPVLLTLNVSKNPIKTLKIQSNLKLHSFVATGINSLKTIDEDAFLKLEPANKCISLAISNNEKLSFIHEKCLDHMSLCSLDLSNNLITYVSSKLIRSTESFKPTNINLQGNPFNCNCSLQWMLNDLVPKLYSEEPNLLEDLRCASPPQISNMRMVHWYKWKEQVFCTDISDFVEDLSMDVVSVSSSKMVIFESSPGLLAVLGTAISVLTILVIVGLLLTRRYYLKRTRINRRF